MYWRDQDEQLLRQYTYAGGDFTSDFDTSNKAFMASWIQSYLSR